MQLDLTTYDFACGDVMDGCPATFRGASDDIVAQVAEHARDAHGIEQVPPDVIAAVQEQLRPVA